MEARKASSSEGSLPSRPRHSSCRQRYLIVGISNKQKNRRSTWLPGAGDKGPRPREGDYPSRVRLSSTLQCDTVIDKQGDLRYDFGSNTLIGRMAKLADALRSGRSGRKLLGVQVPLRPPWFPKNGELFVSHPFLKNHKPKQFLG